MADAAAKEEDYFTSNPAPAEPSSPLAAGGHVRGRVLVVDDEPLVAEMVRRALSDAHDVTIAGGIAGRRLNGDVHEDPVHVLDGVGRPVRSIEYGGAAAFAAHDRPIDAAIVAPV